MDRAELKVVIMGGGPAGLAAGKVLTDHDAACEVFEKDDGVGGLSRTHSYHGFLFDLGGHRFFTKKNELDQFLHELMVDEMIEVSRSSKIYFMGKYFNYPPTFLNAFTGLGVKTSAEIFYTFLKERLRYPKPEIVTLEDWLVSQFGRRMYELFFKTYTEKVWGLPCNHGSAVWAAQRIKGMSLLGTIKEAILPSKGDKPVSLIGHFKYPAHGIGRISERMAQEIRKRNQVHLNSMVSLIRHDGSKVTGVVVETPEGQREVTGTHFLSSVPVTELVQHFDPPAPPEVCEAARTLRYRDLLIVAIMFDQERITEDTWIYIPDPTIKFGRLHEPTNWSAAMSPPGKTTLVFEYFCFNTDPIWSMPDQELVDMTLAEFARTGLAPGVEKKVIDHCIVRATKAYPIHTIGHLVPLKVIKDFVERFNNLTLIGRYGQFVYNNIDHSIETGISSARQILGFAPREGNIIEDEYLETKYNR